MRINNLETLLPITGMTCSSCAVKIEKAIMEVPGIASAHVDIATETAELNFTNGCVETDVLVEAVKHAGFDVITEEITLEIGGMTCISCAAHIEGALSDVPGVLRAIVNLASESANIVYIPQWAEITDITNAVIDIGYRIVDKEDHETSGDDEKDSDQVERGIKERPLSMMIVFGIIILIILGMVVGMAFGIV